MPKLSDTEAIALIANQSALGQVAVWAKELLAERDRLKRCIDNAIKAANRSGDDYLPESTVGRMIAALHAEEKT